MTTPSPDDSQVAAILRELVPGSDMIDDETLDAIARGEPVHYDVSDASASLDLTQVVEVLRDYVPIVSGMLTTGKILYDAARSGTGSIPTAEEIAAASRAREPQIRVKANTLLIRIAEAVRVRLR